MLYENQLLCPFVGLRRMIHLSAALKLCFECFTSLMFYTFKLQAENSSLHSRLLMFAVCKLSLKVPVEVTVTIMFVPLLSTELR